jgi:TP901 family phage tail tape measure protein
MRAAGFAFAGIGAAALGGFGQAISAAGEFQSTMVRIGNLTGATGFEFQKFHDLILDTAPDLGMAPNEFAKALYFSLSVMEDANTAFEATRLASQAAAIGMGDAEAITRILAATTNVYNLQAKDLTRIMDQLTVAVRLGGAESGQLVDVLGSVIPIAAMMGVSFSEVVAHLATMTAAGIPAAEAVTFLRRELVTFLGPSGETSKALATLGFGANEAREMLNLLATDTEAGIQAMRAAGVSWDQMAKVMKTMKDDTAKAELQLQSFGVSAQVLRDMIGEQGLTATLKYLNDATVAATGSQEAAANALGKVFGNIRGLIGYLATLGTQYEKTQFIVEAVADANGDLAKAFENTTATYAFQSAKFGASMKELQIALGETLLPMVTVMIKPITNLVQAFASWAREMPEVASVLMGLTATLGTAFSVLAGGAFAAQMFMASLRFMKTGVPGVISAIEGLTGATAAQAAAHRAASLMMVASSIDANRMAASDVVAAFAKHGLTEAEIASTMALAGYTPAQIAAGMAIHGFSIEAIVASGALGNMTVAQATAALTAGGLAEAEIAAGLATAGLGAAGVGATISLDGMTRAQILAAVSAGTLGAEEAAVALVLSGMTPAAATAALATTGLAEAQAAAAVSAASLTAAEGTAAAGASAAVAPWLLLAAVIVAAAVVIGAVTYALITDWQGLRTSLVDITKDIAEAFAGAFEAILSFLQEWSPLIAGLLLAPFTGGFSLVIGAVIQFRDEIADAFQGLAEVITDAVEVIGDAVGFLPEIFFRALSAVLNIVTTVGEAIADVLQFLNPFAKHSPSLVEDVEEGVWRILAAYAQLSGIRPIFEDAGAAVEDFKSAMSGVTDSLEAQRVGEIEETLALVDPGLVTAYGNARFAMEALESAMAGLDAELATQNALLSQLQGELDTARAYVEALGDAYDNATEQLRYWSEVAITGTHAYEDALYGLSQALAGAQLAELQYEDANIAEIRALEDEIDSLQGLDSAARDAFEAQKDAAEATEDTTEAVDANAAAIDALESQIDALRYAWEAYKIGQERIILDEDRQVNALDDQIDALKDQKDALKDQLDALGKSSEEYQRLTKEIENLGAAMDATDDLIEILSFSTTDYDEGLDNLVGALEAHKRAMGREQDQLEDQRDALGDESDEAEALKDQIKALEDQIKALNDEQEIHKNRIRDIRLEMRALELDYQTQRNALEAQRDALKETDEALDKHAETAKKAAKYTSQYSEETKKLQARLKELRDGMKPFQRTIEDLRREADMLDLQHQLDVGDQLRAIDEALHPIEEFPYEAIISNIKFWVAQVDALKEAQDKAKDSAEKLSDKTDAQKKAVDDLTDAHRALETAQRDMVGVIRDMEAAANDLKSALESGAGVDFEDLQTDLDTLMADWDAKMKALEDELAAAFEFKIPGSELFEPIKKAFGVFAKWMKNWWREVLTGLFLIPIMLPLGPINALVVNWDRIWKVMKIVAEAVWGGLKAGWETVTKFFGSAWDTVSGALTNTWSNVWSSISAFVTGLPGSVWNMIQDAWSTVWGALTETAKNLGETLKDTWNTVWTSVLDFVSGPAGAIWNVIETAWKALWNVLETIAEVSPIKVKWDNIWNGIKIGWDVFLDILKKAWGLFWDALGAVTDAAGKVGGVLRKAWDAVWTTIRDSVTGTASSFWNIMQESWNTFIEALSKAFEVAGKAGGILYKAWDTAWTAIRDTVTGGAGAIWDGMMGAWGAFIDGLGNAFELAGKAGGVLWDAFTGVWETLYDWVASPLIGVFARIAGAWDTMVSTMGTAFGTLADLLKNPINAVIGGIEWLINQVLAAVNKVGSAIAGAPIIGAGIEWDETAWGPITLPRLAHGGIVTEPTAAMIAEEGPEAVVPLRDYDDMRSSMFPEHIEIEITAAETLPVELRAVSSRAADAFTSSIVPIAESIAEAAWATAEGVSAWQSFVDASLSQIASAVVPIANAFPNLQVGLADMLANLTTLALSAETPEDRAEVTGFLQDFLTGLVTLGTDITNGASLQDVTDDLYGLQVDIGKALGDVGKKTVAVGTAVGGVKGAVGDVDITTGEVVSSVKDVVAETSATRALTDDWVVYYLGIIANRSQLTSETLLQDMLPVLEEIRDRLPLPSAQLGGFVQRSGPINVHAGETIVPAGAAASGPNIELSLTFNGPVSRADGKEIANDVQGAIDDSLKKWMRRITVLGSVV